MHSDLKPENILLDYTGHIALCDFGLCKLNMSEKDTTNSEQRILPLTSWTECTGSEEPNLLLSQLSVELPSSKYHLLRVDQEMA